MKRRDFAAVLFIGLPPIVKQIGKAAKQVAIAIKEFVEFILRELTPS